MRRPRVGSSSQRPSCNGHESPGSTFSASRNQRHNALTTLVSSLTCLSSALASPISFQPCLGFHLGRRVVSTQPPTSSAPLHLKTRTPHARFVIAFITRFVYAEAKAPDTEQTTRLRPSSRDEQARMNVSQSLFKSSVVLGDGEAASANSGSSTSMPGHTLVQVSKSSKNCLATSFRHISGLKTYMSAEKICLAELVKCVDLSLFLFWIGLNSSIGSPALSASLTYLTCCSRAEQLF